MPSVGDLMRGKPDHQVPKAVRINIAKNLSDNSLKNIVETSKPTQNSDREEECSASYVSLSISDSEASGIQTDPSCVFYDAVSCLSSASNLCDQPAECSSSSTPENQKKPTDCKHIRKSAGGVCTSSKSSEPCRPEDYVVPGEEELKRFGGTPVCPPTFEMANSVKACLPVFVRGVVSRGFGRGSRELGTPTANMDQAALTHLHENLLLGVYCGWAKVEPWPVMKMVMNLGLNPFFGNKEKTLEVHILHEFPLDFYGAHMRICILEYLRPEAKFGNLKDLIAAIKNDVEVARKLLDKPEYLAYRTHSYFSTSQAPK